MHQLSVKPMGNKAKWLSRFEQNDSLLHICLDHDQNT